MNVVIIIYLNLSIYRETEGKQLASSGSISSPRLLSSLPCHQEWDHASRNTSFQIPQTSHNLVFLYSAVKPAQAHFSSPRPCQGRLHTNITGVSITDLHSEGTRQTSPGDWGLQTAEARWMLSWQLWTPRKWELVDPLFHTHAYKPKSFLAHFIKFSRGSNNESAFMVAWTSCFRLNSLHPCFHVSA